MTGDTARNRAGNCKWAWALLVTAAATAPAAAAAPALDILFYGNSFTLQGAVVPEVSGVPTLVQRIAMAAGQTTPNVVNAAVSGWTLSNHISSNTGVISSSPQSGSWDYVVLQEYSTKPTDIAGVGNPTAFKNDAQSLYGLVKANSANVKPVLFETWSRHPNDTAELGAWYTSASLPTYTAKADQMQSELKRYYGEAQAQVGATVAKLAPVGDAFKASGWDVSLYNGDLYHESSKGAMLAALILYETIYGDTTADISYTTMNSNLTLLHSGLTLSNFSIANAAAWDAMTTQADAAVAAVPEPASLGLLVIGGLLLTARRQARV